MPDERQMVVGIDFPTWNTLSDPVKSLISFMLEDSSLFFSGEEDEYCDGVICSNTRYRTINFMYDGSNAHFTNGNLLFAIPFKDMTDGDTYGYLNSYTGILYSLDEEDFIDLTTVHSKLNLYISNNADDNTTHQQEICETRMIEPLCDIPVTISAIFLDDQGNKLNINTDSGIRVVFNEKSCPDLEHNDMTVVPIVPNEEITSFEYGYQLRTSSFKVATYESFSAFESHNPTSVFSMYYKLGLCPLNNQWKDFYWNDNEFSPQKLSATITMDSFKEILKSNVFSARNGSVSTTSIGYETVSISNTPNPSDIYMREIVAAKMGYTLDYDSDYDDGSYYDAGGYMIKNRYILPVYHKDANDNDSLYGFCYLTAYYDNHSLNSSSVVGKEVPEEVLDKEIVLLSSNYSETFVDWGTNDYMNIMCDITDEHMDDNAYIETAVAYNNEDV